jgi:hypothetical protein
MSLRVGLVCFCLLASLAGCRDRDQTLLVRDLKSTELSLSVHRDLQEVRLDLTWPERGNGCVGLPAGTYATLDGQRMETITLGGKYWSSSGSSGLPFSQCRSEAAFRLPLASIEYGHGIATVAEIFDGRSRVLMSAVSLFEDPHLEISPTPLHAGEKWSASWTPVTHQAVPELVTVLFRPKGAQRNRALIKGNARVGQARLEFDVPHTWLGEGTMSAMLSFHAALTRCEGISRCVAHGGHLSEKRNVWIAPSLTPLPCPTSKLTFTQKTGCKNEGLLAFCLPKQPPELQGLVMNFAPSLDSWDKPFRGNVGCAYETEKIFYYPTSPALNPESCAPNGAMSNLGWEEVCAVARIAEVKRIAPVAAPAPRP